MKVILDELLSIAITHEIRSQALYAHLQGVVVDPEAREFLRCMEEEEHDHERRLLELRASDEYDGSIPIDVPSIVDEIRRSHTVYVTLGKDASRNDVLLLVEKREQRAALLFQRLASINGNETIRLFFEQLAAEELEHERAAQSLFGEPVESETPDPG